MQKDVTQGKSYCLTVYSVPCKVTAIGKDNIEYTLLNISETGQYLFIAPTWKVNISQDDASIVETFNLAGTGKVGRSGSGSNPTYGFLKIIFVDALPPISEAKENTLYFVPKDGTAPDNYDEYIFDPVNQQFELVGQSAIDTSDVPLFNPAEAQTITGAYDFQDGLTRTTKDSPSTTDIMNKEMSDNLYIPKTSNSDIGGIKTFTDGIILADEKQLQLGTGTDALKIHGTGTGKAVIEGTNASELDIAVPVNIQENAHISTLSTDVTGLGKTILFRFKNDTASQDDMVLYMYGTTSLVGIQGSTLGGGFNVAKQGRVTCENSLLVRGGANFQSGVTLGQTLTVTGIATFLAVPRCSISPTATNQLTNKNYVDETIQQNINTTLEGVIKFASMTEAEYKALEVKSPSTIYYLTDVPLWVIGDQEIVTSNMPA